MQTAQSDKLKSEKKLNTLRDSTLKPPLISINSYGVRTTES